jgi:hypothetical protein
MDPDGEITRWFTERLKQIKQGNTGAVPYGLNRDLAKLPNFEQGPAQGPNTPIDWYPQTEQQENKGFYGPGKADRAPGAWLTAMTLPVQLNA